jgi:ATP diphosphatase
LFDFQSVVDTISEKMLRRHPHVFGDDEVASVAEQSAAWERLKAAERTERSASRTAGQLDGVARALPALSRAEKLQRRAAKAGFDWPTIDGVLAKVREEVLEVEAERESGVNPEMMRAEIGDLLFSCVNLARHLGVNAEDALRDANGKFERRFRAMERILGNDGRRVSDATPQELDDLWERVKSGQGREHA